tara:strand:- start:444 stop:644 length:201 start_codon:yes stop_codon:yes gene_type:complete
MDIKLTNGKKIIIRSKEQYDANPLHFKMRGYAPVGQESTEIKKNTDKVVQLKPKKKKNVKKTKKKD